MIHRTRRELYDFLCLVLETKPVDPGPRTSLAALAAAVGVRSETVEHLVAIGLIGHRGAAADRDEDAVRVVTVAARLVELGATTADLAALADAIAANCEACRHDPCPTHCDTLFEVRGLLARLSGEVWADAGAGKRAIGIAQAIRSIDALQDLT